MLPLPSVRFLYASALISGFYFLACQYNANVIKDIHPCKIYAVILIYLIAKTLGSILHQKSRRDYEKGAKEKKKYINSCSHQDIFWFYTLE